jgi:hypothetical protein
MIVFSNIYHGLKRESSVHWNIMAKYNVG